jgi:hypothetical protein
MFGDACAATWNAVLGVMYPLAEKIADHSRASSAVVSVTAAPAESVRVPSTDAANVLSVIVVVGIVVLP